VSPRLVGELQVPPYFHPAADWATLVVQGVIDGAIVTSLCHDQPLPANHLPRWPGVRVVLLGTLELQLVIHRRWAEVWDQRVLLPSERVMPLLHQELGTGVSGLERPSRAWQDPKVWLRQLQERPLALPVCPALAPRSWWQEQGLVAVVEQPTLRERLWLLLPLALQILHLRSDATAGELKPERLAAAGGEQAVHIHPGEPIQQQQRRAVWTQAVAHIGRAAMQQGAIQFDEAELQGC
jgi:hypothetical protein